MFLDLDQQTEFSKLLDDLFACNEPIKTSISRRTEVATPFANASVDYTIIAESFVDIGSLLQQYIAVR